MPFSASENEELELEFTVVVKIPLEMQKRILLMAKQNSIQELDSVSSFQKKHHQVKVFTKNQSGDKEPFLDKNIDKDLSNLNCKTKNEGRENLEMMHREVINAGQDRLLQAPKVAYHGPKSPFVDSFTLPGNMDVKEKLTSETNKNELQLSKLEQKISNLENNLLFGKTNSNKNSSLKSPTSAPNDPQFNNLDKKSVQPVKSREELHTPLDSNNKPRDESATTNKYPIGQLQTNNPYKDKHKFKIPESLYRPLHEIRSLIPNSVRFTTQNVFKYLYHKNMLNAHSAIKTQKLNLQVAATQTEIIKPFISKVQIKKELGIVNSYNVLIASQNKKKDPDIRSQKFSTASYMLIKNAKEIKALKPVTSIDFNPSKTLLLKDSMTQTEEGDSPDSKEQEEAKNSSNDELERLGKRIKTLLAQNKQLNLNIIALNKEKIEMKTAATVSDLPGKIRSPNSFPVAEVFTRLVMKSQPQTSKQYFPTQIINKLPENRESLPSAIKTVNVNKSISIANRLSSESKHLVPSKKLHRIEDISRLQLQPKTFFKTNNASVQTTKAHVETSAIDRQEIAEATNAIAIESLKSKIRLLEKHNQELEKVKKLFDEERKSFANAHEVIKREIEAHKGKAEKTLFAYQEEKKRFADKEVALHKEISKLEEETLKSKTKMAFIYEKLFENQMFDLAEEMRQFGGESN
jgi:hypothetical protein